MVRELLFGTRVRPPALRTIPDYGFAVKRLVIGRWSKAPWTRERYLAIIGSPDQAVALATVALPNRHRLARRYVGHIGPASSLILATPFRG